MNKRLTWFGRIEKGPEITSFYLGAANEAGQTRRQRIDVSTPRLQQMPDLYGVILDRAARDIEARL